MGVLVVVTATAMYGRITSLIPRESTASSPRADRDAGGEGGGGGEDGGQEVEMLLPAAGLSGGAARGGLWNPEERWGGEGSPYASCMQCALHAQPLAAGQHRQRDCQCGVVVSDLASGAIIYFIKTHHHSLRSTFESLKSPRQYEWPSQGNEARSYAGSGRWGRFRSQTAWP
jgi:hypothetical protein